VIVLSEAVADLGKFRGGGKSADWGHFLYKFVKSKEIFFKYIKILQEFKNLSGGLCPHSATLGSAHVEDDHDRIRIEEDND
jgi:hypothetical protein